MRQALQSPRELARADDSQHCSRGAEAKRDPEYAERQRVRPLKYPFLGLAELNLPPQGRNSAAGAQRRARHQHLAPVRQALEMHRSRRVAEALVDGRLSLAKGNARPALADAIGPDENDACAVDGIGLGRPPRLGFVGKTQRMRRRARQAEVGSDDPDDPAGVVSDGRRHIAKRGVALCRHALRIDHADPGTLQSGNEPRARVDPAPLRQSCRWR